MAVVRRLRQDYRDAWKKLGYNPFMGSAGVVLPPPREFVRVYHITSAPHGISDVGLQRLKVARVSDLNDPFELMAINFRDMRTRRVIADWKREFGMQNGLLCFSADWMNPVLWSHYGSKHSGVCLGFNLHRDHGEPVSYEAERLMDELDHHRPEALTPALQRKLRVTKFQHWIYEGEWRRFVSLTKTVQEGHLHFFGFDNTLQLAEIILGADCALSVDAVRAFTAKVHKDVHVMKARLMHKGFAIVPDEKSW